MKKIETFGDHDALIKVMLMKCNTGERFSFVFLLFYVFCVTSQLCAILILLYGTTFMWLQLSSHYLMHADLFSLFRSSWQSIHFLCGRNDDEGDFITACRVSGRFYDEGGSRAPIVYDLNLGSLMKALECLKAS